MKYFFHILIISLLSITNCLFGQDAYSPFFGSVCIGSGVTTIFDFNESFNGILIPYAAGINSNKWLDENHLLEIGLSFTRRGTRKIEYDKPPQGGSTALIYQIDFYSIDLPVSIYKKFQVSFNTRQIFYRFGFKSSFLPMKPSISDGINSISFDNKIFRNYNIAWNLGLGIEITDHIRADLLCNMFILSMVKPKSKQIFEDLVSFYDSSLYPMEILVSLNYMIK